MKTMNEISSVLGTLDGFNGMFTEYNKDVSGESFRDPLGYQVIWSALARRIFRGQITTVTNDFRNYTLALFHHYLIREAILARDVRVPKSMSAAYQSIDSYNGKTGLIIFLENLFIYTAVLNADDGFSFSGLLGSQSARKTLATFDDDPVIVAANNCGVLIRQLSMGVNGRYKTPLVNMGLFDSSYHYSDNEIWNEVYHIFSGWKEASDLAEKLLSIIRNLFTDDASLTGFTDQMKKAYREIEPDKLKAAAKALYSVIHRENKDLKGRYLKTFQSSENCRKPFKEFWKRHLGLDKDAANSLYEAFDHREKADYKALMERALKNETDKTEQTKINNIL